MMSTIAGLGFLTDFQAQKLAEQLKDKANLTVSALSSQQVYVFDAPLSDSDRKKALDLLNQGQAPELVGAGDGQVQVVVAPRFSTISPWASKATDIFNNCGVDIHRVERVVVYTLTGENLPSRLPAAAEAILHDRMTQSLVYELGDVSALFVDG